MILQWFLWFLLGCYGLASTALMIYGLNAYVLLFLFKKKVKSTRAEQKERAENFLLEAEKQGDEHWPMVTTQLPLYNEWNVAERIIRATAELDYPAGRHQIQIVDDSNDETCDLVDQLAAELSEKGVWIDVCRREGREGYKAGGLKEAMNTAEGEFYAIFDSDFDPEPDFLRKTIPLFKDEKTGLVQARWGHLNPEHSILTRAQSVGIDGHFVVEQVARAANGLFLNFNGTAGVWRKEAIIDGGGWHADTLTEDLDLSYRCQLKGWKLDYAIDVIVPAELPETYSAFKSQQFRWAKGSVQTALKLISSVMKSDISALAKSQAFFHLLHYVAHMMMFALAVLSLPLSLLIPKFAGFAGSYILVLPLIIATFGPSVLYMVSQQYLDPKNWWKKFLYLPGMVTLGFGICISNSRAVMEAFLGIKSGFVRTPKRGSKEVKQYRTKIEWLPYIELFAALYSLFTMISYLKQGTYGGVVFFLFYGVGFLIVGLSSLVEQRAKA